MDQETVDKQWNALALHGIQAAGVSLSPDDGEALIAAGIIAEAGITPAIKKKREETGRKDRSYRLMGFPCSLVPGIPKGCFCWVSKHHTVICLTDSEGRLVSRG